MTDAPLTLMMVHAHPDDEVVGTGGTLARYAEHGARTVLVTATLGEEGQIVDPALNTPEVRERLGEVRRAELARSAEILKISRVELLGYRDSGMAGLESNSHPACFNMADPDEATGRLVRLIRAHRPHVLVTYNERGGYGHPDHIACHRTTLAAWDAAGDPARYPEAGAPWTPLKLYAVASPRSRWQRLFEALRERGVPGPHESPDFDIELFTVPDEEVTTAIQVAGYQDRLREAMLAHRTQFGADGPFAGLPEELMREFGGYEFFTLLASRVPLPQSPHRTTSAGLGYEDDLFAGVRESGA